SHRKRAYRPIAIGRLAEQRLRIISTANGSTGPETDSWLACLRRRGASPVAPRRTSSATACETATVSLICSAKGCREGAVWALRWNNPKIHPPQRRKTWLACDLHRGYLANFLEQRGFLRETVPVPADEP